MNYRVTLLPEKQTFEVDSNEDILSAAHNQGFYLPHGCKNGACGSCKAKIISGSVQHDTASFASSIALSEEEKQKGFALLCCCSAQSDLQIEVSVLETLPVKKWLGRVQKIQRLTADIMILSLQLAQGQTLSYFPGQYLAFILKDGKRRNYSIANAPSQQGLIELHLRHMPGGVFTDYAFNTLKERDLLRFEAPLGNFFLRDSAKPLIFLASGTGFAPINAMVESLIEQNSQRPLYFYWGARQRNDLYYFDLAQKWADNLPHFQFIPVLSKPLISDHWKQRTGLVHRAVMEDFADLQAYEVYACGAPAMVNAAQIDFCRYRQLPETAFFADAFTSALDNPVSTAPPTS